MDGVVGLERLPLGDVEFVLVQLDADHLGPPILEALLRQVEGGDLRLLDVLIVQRVTAGEYRCVEVDTDEFALAGLRLHTPGLISDDDARRFVTTVTVGACGALLLLEPTWTARLSRDIGRHGDRVVATHPIPAVVANRVLEAARRAS